MKAIGWVIFTVLVAVFTATFAIAIYATVTDEDKDPPEVAARKAECRKVIHHVIEVSPGVKNVDEAKAKVPIEDVEQCGAAYPESVACMAVAPDIAAVSACIPASVECEGPTTDVAGKQPVFEVGGECQTVRVAASNARVIIKAAVKSVEITGSDNKIELKLPEGAAAPQVTDRGTGNSVPK